MLKIGTTKMIVRGVVGFSTYWTFKNIIENNISPSSRMQVRQGQIGSMAFGAMVADQTKTWSDEKVEGVYRFLETIRLVKVEVDQSKQTDPPPEEPVIFISPN